MDNPVFLDEDIPFVDSGDYEIDDATGAGHGSTTTLSHGNIIALNHQQQQQFSDDALWSPNAPARRGRRPKSATVVITTAPPQTEPKRRGRKPKQALTSANVSLPSIKTDQSNDILLESPVDANQRQRRTTTTTGSKSRKKPKLDGQQPTTGKLETREGLPHLLLFSLRLR